jgi:hypothetical protein
MALNTASQAKVLASLHVFVESPSLNQDRMSSELLLAALLPICAVLIPL